MTVSRILPIAETVPAPFAKCATALGRALAPKILRATDATSAVRALADLPPIDLGLLLTSLEPDALARLRHVILDAARHMRGES